MYFKITFRFFVITVLSMNVLSLASAAANLASVPVRDMGAATVLSLDGVVEAVRHTVISSQVSGTVIELPVKAGDVVKVGQVLARLDARAALQANAAGKAQVDAARATLALAGKDFERQQLLFDKNYISQAQLDRAQAQYKLASAMAKSQIAQADGAQTQAGFYTLSAPYDGIVSFMPSAVGEIAIPGKPLMRVYDPRQLWVIVTLPQIHAARLSKLKSLAGLAIAFPSLPPAQRLIKPQTMRILPLSDASTQTVQVRFDLPANIDGVNPGLFARLTVNLPPEPNKKAASLERLFVPATAVFRRAEVVAVYVLNAQDRPLLRQVRLGAILGEEQEILSGVSKGERVATAPLAAALSLAQR